MKIAILSFYSTQIERGVETWASNLASRLKKEYTVEILDGRNYKWSNNDWLYHRWLNLKHVISSFKQWSNADIIIPTNGTLQTLVCRILSWLKSKPLVVFGHSGPGADDKWNLLCSPDVFVAFSHSQAKWANRYKLPWTDIKVISHAVDTKLFKPVLEKPKSNLVLCVANNHEHKRINLVANAVAKLPGVKFRAVGPGNESQVKWNEMPAEYIQASVFCFVPWEREAFGLVFLEALACNLPVVTINDAVRQEIVGEAGILVDHPEDANELAKAIKSALNKDWGSSPRQQAEKFSWDKIVSKYQKLFDELCSQ